MGSKNKKQIPAMASSRPSGMKQPRATYSPEDANQMSPVWSIKLFDVHGQWGREKVANAHLWDDLFAKLRHFESMTWGDILKEKQNHHSIAVGSLAKEARQRLAAMRQDDVDEIFRLRLTGKQRVWGIRDRHVLKLLWWDPEHEICPSVLKNT